MMVEYTLKKFLHNSADHRSDENNTYQEDGNAPGFSYHGDGS